MKKQGKLYSSARGTRLVDVSRQRVIRLLEVDAYTKPILVPIGESPMAEIIFKS